MSKEIVIIMGIQAAGKSTLVKKYTDQGYDRLNRDDIGGSLDRLNKELERRIDQGITKFVLDNTYGTKESRKAVIDIAKHNGFKIHCVWVATSIEDAQFNASQRIINNITNNFDPRSKSSIFSPSEMLGPDSSKIFKYSWNIPAIAQFTYKKQFDKPTTEEGFDSVDKVDFNRTMPPEYCHKAIIFDFDGTLRETYSGNKYPISPDDIKILPRRKEVLNGFRNSVKLLGISNQSGVEKGDLTWETAQKCFDKTLNMLNFDPWNFETVFCPHHSFPIRCFCRKPQPGLGVYFILKYKLNPRECIYVGDSTSDKTFAGRCGFQYKTPEEFFGS